MLQFRTTKIFAGDKARRMGYSTFTDYAVQQGLFRSIPGALINGEPY